MIKVDRGGDAMWCPHCGCLQDSNGVWDIPAQAKPCKEHTKSPYWGKTEREIVLPSTNWRSVFRNGSAKE